MGLFDKLTKKNNCSFCGGSIGLLDTTLADGYLCKNCKKKLSPYYSVSKEDLTPQILLQINDREVINKTRLEMFKPNKFYGDFGCIMIDEERKLFAAVPDTSDSLFGSAKSITSLDQIIDKNPDVLLFSQIENVRLDLTMTSREDKQTVDGKQVSYNPKHFTYMCDFTMRMDVNHPYIKSLYIPLSNGTVQIPCDEPRKISSLDREFLSWALDMPGLMYEKNAAYNTCEDLKKLIFGNASGLPDYSYGFHVSLRNKDEVKKYGYYLAMAAEIQKALGKEKKD